MSNPTVSRHDYREDLLGKICRRCNEYQFFDEFTRVRKDSEKRQGVCKSCVRAEQRANPNKYARNLAWIRDKWQGDEAWVRARKAAMSDYRHARRAQETAPGREFVDRYLVFERDNYACQLCGEHMNMEGPARSPRSPSIDHIIPLSRGGAHTYENTQAAHLVCNMSKGARESHRFN